MSMTTELKKENKNLRNEVETARQRELAELRSALTDALHRATEWEVEARRISAEAIKKMEVAREEVTRLVAKVNALARSDTHAKRFDKDTGRSHQGA
jgi:hypothetical protein